jgi:hypothetical protein
MLVVLAHRLDEIATDLVKRWPDARLMTPRDLARPGWSHSHGGVQEERAVLDGAIVPVGEVSVVYTRLSGVTENDLPMIAPDDRRYVAAEMTAFLLSWLSSLACPVVNRPSPLGLAGPNLRPEAWVTLACGEGIPVRSVSRGTDGYQESDLRDSIHVTVVGARWIGEATDELGDRAVRLARAAGVDILTAFFDPTQPGSPLVIAEPFLDLRSDGVADALLEYLSHPSRAEMPR